MATSASGQKLYKWVDENGVTHFGYAPPPVQEREESLEITTIQTGKDDDDTALNNRALSGSWYSRAREYQATRQLKLSYGDFEITDLYPGSYSLVRKKIASGRAELKNSRLHLTYFEHFLEPSKLDTTEEFEAVLTSDTQLELTGPPSKKQIYRKLSKSRNTPFFRDLNGEWTDERGFRYRFSKGSFTVYPDDRPSNQSFGNLEWADPELALDFVADYRNPVDHRQPRTERWVLRQKNTQQLTFVIVGSGTTKLLRRNN